MTNLTAAQAIWSFIFYGGGTAVELWAPHMFYRIVALIGYIFSIIFWLSAWAWSASVASIWLAGSSYYSTGEKPLGGALAGCAGLGAIAWYVVAGSRTAKIQRKLTRYPRILTIVHLAFFIRACVLENTTPGQAELGQVKTEVPPQQYQQPYPAQQQYPAQQPYPAQQAYPQQPYPSQ
jgi:hypothetical protein